MLSLNGGPWVSYLVLCFPLMLAHWCAIRHHAVPICWPMCVQLATMLSFNVGPWVRYWVPCCPLILSVGCTIWPMGVPLGIMVVLGCAIWYCTVLLLALGCAIRYHPLSYCWLMGVPFGTMLSLYVGSRVCH